jgi:hypothetical protein
MDALVFVGRGTMGEWDIYARNPKDLYLGIIRLNDANLFSIHPAADPLIGVSAGPYPDLGAAMSAVARKIGGTCEKWSP